MRWDGMGWDGMGWDGIWGVGQAHVHSFIQHCLGRAAVNKTRECPWLLAVVTTLAVHQGRKGRRLWADTELAV